MNFPRLLPITATVALLLSACGSSNDGQDADFPVLGPDNQIDSGAMRAPTPIRTAGGGSSAASGVQSDAAVLGTDAAISSEMMIAPHVIITEFVAGSGLGALPDNAVGYVFDSGAMPTADDAARVADALGVAGEPVLVDDGYSVHYRVGPDDGSAPAVTVWDDAMLSWNYQNAWAAEPAFECAVEGSPRVVVELEKVDSAVSVDADDVAAAEVPADETQPAEEPVTIETLPRDEMPVECLAPEPPTGVPSAADAEAMVVSFLDALGVESQVTYESWANEWAAGVTASETVDGALVRSWGFNFGGDAVLMHAWGNIAAPQPVGPYDLIDLDTAVARMNDGGYGYGYPGGGIAVMETDIAVSSEIAVAELPPEQGDVSMPGDEIPEPEEITVTFTGVDADLWWVWDVDGSAWLVPAYAFTGDDGGVYTVPAVTDEFLIQVDPPIDEPGIVEPVPGPQPIPVEPGAGDGAEPLPVDPAAGPAALTVVLGDPIGAFTDYAESLGFVVRVVEINGEGLAVTEDFNPDRVNVAVIGDGGEDIVVRATMDDGTLVGETDISGVTLMTIVAVHEGVEYYPACGNETLDFDDVTWYPLTGEDNPLVADILASVGAVDREAFPVTSGFARVAPPGPGDDVGTLVVWMDGVARWISDSGSLDVWLYTAEIEYAWEC